MKNAAKPLLLPALGQDILYGYGAYSRAFANLWGTTDPNTFWGGAKIVFAF